MPQATDELVLASVLRERLSKSQDTLMEAIRQRDKARLENQRLILALRDAIECSDHTESTLVENLREWLGEQSFRMSDTHHYITVDASEWPNNWHFGRMFDVMLEHNGEPIQVQFWLVEFADQTAVYQALRLC